MDWVRLKRVVRYLKRHPRLIWDFPWQEESEQVTVFVDSDWAGCRRSRRSTSGGVVLFGKHLITHWARTQGVVALSSGEAEMYASIEGWI